ncbi:amidohydrolase family protein [Pseudodesulfovibrio indicus]|uniref:Amidohydrolase n=1 Tax=Pseudodesulfovibrio indicus TaxID=1716143 RepID=A0A126QKI8_9BACT|nr:amidohydrolase family protein [Pseudodesulfovibrio indicus]AMK10279.1 amidohydrolase [Pseudodesulfovibrio indicus]TDT82017.1 imidazolonepropionase-like amidohydrolase [Pseudodesulfovibrio indicus]
MLSRRDFLTVLARVAPFAWALSPAGPIPRALAGPDRTSPGAIFALAGTVLPGRGDPLPGHAVLIRHGRIEAVVPAGLPRDRPVVAPPDAWILPGVINAHCHHAHTPEDRRRLWLESGVTALGDAASPLAALPDLLRSPAGTTATASACGPMLAPPGGYPLNAHTRDMALEINSPARGEDAVRRLADLGAGSVKIAFEPGNGPAPLPLFDAATARAVCDTARRLGLGVRAHVQDLSGLEPALNAGVRTIEHVPHVLRTPDGPAPVLDKSGAVLPAYRTLLERMARDGVILTPTLDVLSRTPWGGPALFEPVRTFHAMGGRVALGNDYPYRRTDAGMPAPEMRLLAEAGLPPEAVVEAATANAAEACGLRDRGLIAPGMAADLLVVRGFPTPDELQDPLHIVKDGVFIR